MKKFYILILFLLISNISFAEVGYNNEIIDNSLYINTTIILHSSEDIDIYNMSWTLPKNSIVVKIEDESGPVKYYSQINDEVNFVTNKDNDKRNEIIKIEAVQNNVFNYKFYPFGMVDISLPGFENDKSIVSAKIGNLLINSIAFNSSINFKDNIIIERTGPISFRAFTGDAKEDGYYYIFSSHNISSVNENYGLVAGTIGIVPFYTKFRLCRNPLV